MVKLQSRVTESVSLTRQEGEPICLSGNKLYFRYYVKVAHGKEEVRYGCVDLGVSRKDFTPVTFDQVPKGPQYKKADVDPDEIAFGLWMIQEAGLPCKSRFGYPVKGYQNISTKDRDDVDLQDFKAAAHENWSCECDSNHNAVKPAYWWRITDALLNRAKGMAEERAQAIEAELNRGWKPTRELDESDTAIVLAIFDFNGDEKGLVTALKSSWGADIRDRDVKIDKLLTKKIKLPKLLEEYIP